MPPSETSECSRQAERYNRESRCATLNREALRAELLQQPCGADLYRMIEERPCLFTDVPVFIPETIVRQQTRLIAAIERLIAMPAFRQRVLAHAPETAQYVPKAQGVFYSYDFHVSAGSTQLIEINSDAGGALLNAPLLRAQRPCDVATAALQNITGNTPEQLFWAMFIEEWRLEHGDAPLRTIAIVDAEPASQFLYPEFLLFRNLFQDHGVDTVICDPGDLAYRNGALLHGERRIDLVYNRLTDFSLQEPPQQQLRAAYLAGAAVVTPHPRAHALYADKRNLAIMTDAAALTELGVDAATQAVLLEGIAYTEVVHREDAARLWAERKRLFFKPATGYGGKGVYRGDKMTRRVFDEILHGNYVAQKLVPPSHRHLNFAGAEIELKLDLRHYVYRGQLQMLATRLYQGQTTNFRTPGGGFAPVIVLPCGGDRAQS